MIEWNPLHAGGEEVLVFPIALVLIIAGRMWGRRLRYHVDNVGKVDDLCPWYINGFTIMNNIDHAISLNVKHYLINHLISMMLSGRCFVFLFHQGTEQPHQGDVNTRVAIPNTTEEVRN